MIRELPFARLQETPAAKLMAVETHNDPIRLTARLPNRSQMTFHISDVRLAGDGKTFAQNQSMTKKLISASFSSGISLEL